MILIINPVLSQNVFDLISEHQVAAKVGIVTLKSNFVIRYSVTPLQKVTEVTVTPLLCYFYKIKSQKRRKAKGIDDAAAN